MKTSVRAVSAMFILNGLLFGAWAARIPFFKDRFDLSPGELGLILLALGGGAVLSFPFAGVATDRFGSARLTRWVIWPYMAGLILIAMAPGPIALGLAVLIFGASHGAMDVSMNAWAAEVETASGRPIMSMFHAMFSLGAGIGAGAGALAAGVGIIPLWEYAGLLIILAPGLVFMAQAEWITPDRKSEPGPAFALPSGALVIVGLIALSAMLGEGALADWTAVLMIDTTGTSASLAATGYAVFSVAMVIMRLSGPIILARFDPILVVRLCACSALLGALMVSFAPVVAISFAGLFLMGVGYSLIVPLAFARAANDPVIEPGKAIAGVATFGYGGMLMGPVIIGGLAELVTLGQAFSILAILACFIVLKAGSLRTAKSG